MNLRGCFYPNDVLTPKKLIYWVFTLLSIKNKMDVSRHTICFELLVYIVPIQLLIPLVYRLKRYRVSSLTFDVNFINNSAFTLKSTNIQSYHQHLFALLGSSQAKAALKTLLKLTPAIKRARFSCESWFKGKF